MKHRAISRVIEVANLEARRLFCAVGASDWISSFPAGDDEPAHGSLHADAATVDVLTVPNFNSRGGAPRSVYLDFNGHPAIDNWGGWWEFGGRNVTATPAYDIDGDLNSFSVQEVANIRQIWKGVAEKFSPFDIDVTTVKPSTINGVRVVIGGDGAWRG